MGKKIINGDLQINGNLQSTGVLDNPDFKTLRETIAQLVLDTNFTYTTSGDDITLTAYTGKSASLNISEKLPLDTNIVDISTIFQNKTNLRVLMLPDSIQSFTQNALEGCTNLETLEIPFVGQQLNTSGFNKYSFLGAPNVKYLTVKHGTVLSTGEKVVPAGAFATGTSTTGKNLESINLPSDATVIEANAFAYCNALKTVDIPEGYTTIESGAFNDAGALSKITLPKSITIIADDFNIYPSGSGNLIFNCYYSGTIDDWCTKIDFQGHPMMNIHTDRVTKHLYINNKLVTDIEISASLINKKAFMNCFDLKTVTLKSGVGRIKEYAFAMTPLTTVKNLSKTWNAIESNAFAFCQNLTSIIIPKTVLTMGSNVFQYCNNLSIKCEAAEKPAGWADDWNPDNRPVEWGYTG